MHIVYTLQWPNNCISWAIYFTIGEIAKHWSIILCSIKGKVKASFPHSKKDSTIHGIKVWSFIWFTNVTKEKMKWLSSLKTALERTLWFCLFKMQIL